MSGVGESRTELLNWLNDLLRLNYKKIEECGTGAAYCQIMDSIYGDVPMHRVRFNSTAEYENQVNYKILQSNFTKHHIEKTVYVDKLIKCKFQDNLEFLQWLKKYWMNNKDGSEYDAEARRRYRAVGTSNSGNNTPISYSNNSSSTTLNVAKRRSTTENGGYLSRTHSLSSRYSSSGNSGATRRVSSEQVIALQTELSQAHNKIQSMEEETGNFKEALTAMEAENNFYFSKLRDIEILVQTTQDFIKEGLYSGDVKELEKFTGKVQQILYATIDSQPNDEVNREHNLENINEETPLHNGHHLPQTEALSSNNNLIIDEETF
ncbi:Protein BIM1 [Nakaseomyces bracarensis]|uniref:Protein BIM1 n=1 Tax=Nakaseomyces bracarensis TaxID=273131 RepID=A0ABR4NSE2_9SACH